MPADLVETVIEDSRWQALGLAALAERAAGAALRQLGLRAEGFEIALLGTDDARIAALNAGFRGRKRPTNVLSWPATEHESRAEGARPAPPPPGGEAREPLGDIALAFETCAAEAVAAGTPLPDHVTHLVVHGVLHLLGYDHLRDGDATLMEGLEAEILATLGVRDPYS